MAPKANSQSFTFLAENRMLSVSYWANYCENNPKLVRRSETASFIVYMTIESNHVTLHVQATTCGTSVIAPRLTVSASHLIAAHLTLMKAVIAHSWGTRDRPLSRVFLCLQSKTRHKRPFFPMLSADWAIIGGPHTGQADKISRVPVPAARDSIIIMCRPTTSRIAAF